MQDTTTIFFCNMQMVIFPYIFYGFLKKYVIFMKVLDTAKLQLL